MHTNSGERKSWGFPIVEPDFLKARATLDNPHLWPRATAVPGLLPSPSNAPLATLSPHPAWEQAVKASISPHDLGKRGSSCQPDSPSVAGLGKAMSSGPCPASCPCPKSPNTFQLFFLPMTRTALNPNTATCTAALLLSARSLIRSL